MALALWDAYTSLVAWFATGRIPILNVGCNDFTNTLLAAAFIRGNLPHRTHWWRAFIATLMVAMGASCRSPLTGSEARRDATADSIVIRGAGVMIMIH